MNFLPNSPYSKRRDKPAAISVFGILLTAFIAGMIFKGSIMDLAFVYGESMSPTIKPGSIAIIWRPAYGLINPFSGSYIFLWASPQAGDIVYIAGNPVKSRSLVKRVLETGPAYIYENDGRMVTWTATPSSQGKNGNSPIENSKAFFIPGGRVYLLGDNSDKSYDSRDFGSVPIESIRGKIIFYQGLPIP